MMLQSQPTLCTHWMTVTARFSHSAMFCKNNQSMACQKATEMNSSGYWGATTTASFLQVNSLLLWIDNRDKMKTLEEGEKWRRIIKRKRMKKEDQQPKGLVAAQESNSLGAKVFSKLAYKCTPPLLEQLWSCHLPWPHSSCSSSSFFSPLSLCLLSQTRLQRYLFLNQC